MLHAIPDGEDNESLKMIEEKQGRIVEELQRRIETGIYEEKLPPALQLAEEFGVNFKTLNKAIAQLVNKGMLTRKAGRGTFIVKEKQKLESTLVELLFVSSGEISGHPFYNDLWHGLLDAFKDTDFKLVLTRLEENTEQAGLKTVCKKLTPSAGKILVGTAHPGQVRQLQRAKCPFVLAGSKSADPSVYTVHCDATKAISQAIGHLQKKQIREIAFIGLTRDQGELLGDLDKFHAYLAAVQAHEELDSGLIEHAPPFSRYGYEAMKKILSRKRPGAVLVAYDHLCPGVYQAIAEEGLRIPGDISVIGIDGIQTGLTPKLTSIFIDRYQIGLHAGQLLLNLIRTPSRHTRSPLVLDAAFNPAAGESVLQ